MEDTQNEIFTSIHTTHCITWSLPSKRVCAYVSSSHASIMSKQLTALAICTQLTLNMLTVLNTVFKQQKGSIDIRQHGRVTKILIDKKIFIV